MDEHDGSEDKQDRYTDKSDREANLERKADVTAANARRESAPRTPPPPPPPLGEYQIPRIPRSPGRDT